MLNKLGAELYQFEWDWKFIFFRYGEGGFEQLCFFEP